MRHGVGVTEYIFSPLLPLVLMLWVLCVTVIVLVHATRMNMFAHSLFRFRMTVWLKSKSGLSADDLKPIVFIHCAI